LWRLLDLYNEWCYTSSPCPPKIDVALKITIGSKSKSDISKIQWQPYDTDGHWGVCWIDSWPLMAIVVLLDRSIWWPPKTDLAIATVVATRHNWWPPRRFSKHVVAKQIDRRPLRWLPCRKWRSQKMIIVGFEPKLW